MPQVIIVAGVLLNINFSYMWKIRPCIYSIEIELCGKWDTESEIISSNTTVVNNIAWSFLTSHTFIW